MMMMNNEEEGEIPTGYRFSPSDKELIQYYLRGKVDGEPLHPLTPIVEKNLYGSNQPSPWEIFRGITRTHSSSTTCDEDFDFYFFTLVKKKFGKGKTMERKIATGTWKIQNNNPVYEDDEEGDSTEKKKKRRRKIKSSSRPTVGRKKTLNYVEGSKEVKDEQGNSLIMHEYSLNEYPKHETENWVLCRLRMGKPSKDDLHKRSLSEQETDQLCEPEKKRCKSSSVQVESSTTSTLTAATSTSVYGDGEGLLVLQQSQPCSGTIDDDLCGINFDYQAGLAIFDASFFCQQPQPQLLRANSNGDASTYSSTWTQSEVSIPMSDMLNIPPIVESPSQYNNHQPQLFCNGTTSCPSSCPTGTQGEISVPMSGVLGMLPIEEPPSQYSNYQPQLCANSNGTTSCPSSCPAGTQGGDVLDMLPIEEPPSQSQLECQRILNILRSRVANYNKDEILDLY